MRQFFPRLLIMAEITLIAWFLCLEEPAFAVDVCAIQKSTTIDTISQDPCGKITGQATETPAALCQIYHQGALKDDRFVAEPYSRCLDFFKVALEAKQFYCMYQGTNFQLGSTSEKSNPITQFGNSGAGQAVTTQVECAKGIYKFYDQHAGEILRRLRAEKPKLSAALKKLDSEGEALIRQELKCDGNASQLAGFGASGLAKIDLSADALGGFSVSYQNVYYLMRYLAHLSEDKIAELSNYEKTLPTTSEAKPPKPNTTLTGGNAETAKTQPVINWASIAENTVIEAGEGVATRPILNFINSMKNYGGIPIGKIGVAGGAVGSVLQPLLTIYLNKNNLGAHDIASALSSTAAWYYTWWAGVKLLPSAMVSAAVQIYINLAAQNFQDEHNSIVAYYRNFTLCGNGQSCPKGQGAFPGYWAATADKAAQNFEQTKKTLSYCSECGASDTTERQVLCPGQRGAMHGLNDKGFDQTGMQERVIAGKPCCRYKNSYLYAVCRKLPNANQQISVTTKMDPGWAQDRQSYCQ